MDDIHLRPVQIREFAESGGYRRRPAGMMHGTVRRSGSWAVPWAVSAADRAEVPDVDRHRRQATRWFGAPDDLVGLEKERGAVREPDLKNGVDQPDQVALQAEEPFRSSQAAWPFVADGHSAYFEVARDRGCS